MNNFIFSLNATLPVFIIIVLGYILMQAGIFNKEFTSVADKYVFKVALPVLLFKDIATTNIRQCFDLKFVLFCSLATISMFLIIWLFATIFIKDKTIHKFCLPLSVCNVSLSRMTILLSQILSSGK